MTRPKSTGIRREAHRYMVNGRTPLECLMFYYYRRTDRRSGIVNDANERFQDSRDLVTAIQLIVYLSVETAKIVDRLPDPMTEDVVELTLERGEGQPQCT
ncbi:MAG: helicase [Chloroflexota bacterium]|nr:helicase [Chloroflexota bacterium]